MKISVSSPCTDSPASRLASARVSPSSSPPPPIVLLGGEEPPPTSTRPGCQERHSLPTHHNSPSSLLRNPSHPVKRTQPFLSLKFSISSQPGWQAGTIKATQFVR